MDNLFHFFCQNTFSGDREDIIECGSMYGVKHNPLEIDILDSSMLTVEASKSKEVHLCFARLSPILLPEDLDIESNATLLLY